MSLLPITAPDFRTRFRFVARRIMMGLPLLLCACADPPKHAAGPEPDPRFLVDQFSGISIETMEQARSLILFRYFNAPELTRRVPDAILTRASTGKKSRLHDLIEDCPSVLLFGSASCSHLDYLLTDFIELSRSFGDRVDFHFIYIREAHPEGGLMPSIEQDHQSFEMAGLPDSQTMEERRAAAAAFQETLGSSIEVWIDSMDDFLAARWSAWPARVVVVGADLKLLYLGGPGPWYYKPSRDSWHDAPPESMESIFRQRHFDDFSLEEFLETVPPKVAP